jgi:hypothetical protein
MHPSDGGMWKRHQLRLKEATDAGYWNPGDGYPALEKMKKPQGTRRYGKCPECHEYGWLFTWQGGNDPQRPVLCEGCIDEARDSAADAEAAMEIINEDVDGEDWGHEDSDFGDDMEGF